MLDLTAALSDFKGQNLDVGRLTLKLPAGGEQVKGNLEINSGTLEGFKAKADATLTQRSKG